MEKVFKMNLEHLVTADNSLYDENDFSECAEMFNAIAYECQYNAGWHEGMRNTIAVDLCIVSHMLGLDPMEVYEAFKQEKLIDPVTDDEDTEERFQRICGYLEYWRNWNYVSYMLNRVTWIDANVKQTPIVRVEFE